MRPDARPEVRDGSGCASHRGAGRVWVCVPPGHGHGHAGAVPYSGQAVNLGARPSGARTRARRSRTLQRAGGEPGCASHRGAGRVWVCVPPGRGADEGASSRPGASPRAGAPGTDEGTPEPCPTMRPDACPEVQDGSGCASHRGVGRTRGHPPDRGRLRGRVYPAHGRGHAGAVPYNAPGCAPRGVGRIWMRVPPGRGADEGASSRPGASPRAGVPGTDTGTPEPCPTMRPDARPTGARGGSGCATLRGAGRVWVRVPPGASPRAGVPGTRTRARRSRALQRAGGEPGCASHRGAGRTRGHPPDRGRLRGRVYPAHG